MSGRRRRDTCQNLSRFCGIIAKCTAVPAVNAGFGKIDPDSAGILQEFIAAAPVQQTTEDRCDQRWWSGAGGIQALSARSTGFLQCFDTVGLVI